MADVQLISMNLPNDEDTYYFTDKDAQDKIDALGTASTKNVPISGDAGNNEVVLGNDTRLTDARPASDVSAWAKESTKPSYTKSEVGLGNVDNTSDSTKKTNFTGSIASGNTGFTTGGDVYTALGNKVDKVTGKQLSTEDYTTAEKTKLSGISAGANKTEASTTNGNIKIDDVETPVYRNYGNNTVLTTDKTPFLTRQTLNPAGFSGYVREKLVGASYAWNNIVTAKDSGAVNSGTKSYNSTTGELTITGSSGTTGIYGYADAPIINHVYLMACDIKATGDTTISQWGTHTQPKGNIAIMSSYTRQAILFKPTVSGTWVLYVNLITLTSGSFTIKNYIATDLTLAFGSTIADYLYSLTNNGGITKLRDMGFPIDKYTPYGYGLYSVKTSGKKIVGFNLFDEVLELGELNAQGQDATSTTKLRSKNYIRLIGDITSYYFKSSSDAWLCFYDASKSFISAQTATANSTITKPSNAVYCRFNYPTTYGTSYKNDTCINVSTLTGSPKNGDYVPSQVVTYPLGNDELRGKFDLVNNEIVADGDVKESNGVLTRMFGETAFSTLNWGYSSSSKRYEAPLPSNAKNVGTGRFADFVCSNYIPDTSAAVGDTGKCFISSTNIYVYDPNQSGTPTGSCIYPLATPTTEQSTPFADPMSLVGATTEEYIDTRDIPCPVGAERQYMGQSEDVVEIPSSPQSDGKRVLISEVSGGKEQVYWDIPKLYYKEYTVQGDGTKTYGDLLAELKPYYEALSEDEKTYSKVMMRANATGNECLAFVGNYWYSRMGVNASGLWIDQIDFQYNKYFKQASGGSITDYTDANAAYNVFALRVLTYTRAES